MSANAVTANEVVPALDKPVSPELEKLHTDIHAHPELSMQET
jgi:hypothetical protein